MAEAFEEPSIRDLARHGIIIRWDSPVFHRLTAIARLAPGVSRHEAEKLAAVVYDRIKAEEKADRATANSGAPRGRPRRCGRKSRALA